MYFLIILYVCFLQIFNFCRKSNFHVTTNNKNNNTCMLIISKFPFTTLRQVSWFCVWRCHFFCMKLFFFIKMSKIVPRLEWSEKIWSKSEWKLKLEWPVGHFSFSNVKSFVTNFVTFLNICHIRLSQCQNVSKCDSFNPSGHTGQNWSEYFCNFNA